MVNYYVSMQKLVFILLIILIVSGCRSKQPKLTAQQWNDSAVSVSKNYKDLKSFDDALKIVELALLQDSSYTQALKNKLFFEERMGKFERASVTLRKLINQKPDSADLLFKAGLYTTISGDSSSAKKYFEAAIPVYRAQFDTLKTRDPLYMYTFHMYFTTLKMLGQDEIVDAFLNAEVKTAIDSSFWKVEFYRKSKDELVELVKKKVTAPELE